MRQDLIAAALGTLAGFILGYAASEYYGSSIRATREAAETARMTACAKAGGSWVAGNCIGPLPAPEGK